MRTLNDLPVRAGGNLAERLMPAICVALPDVRLVLAAKGPGGHSLTGIGVSEDTAADCPPERRWQAVAVTAFCRDSVRIVGHASAASEEAAMDRIASKLLRDYGTDIYARVED